MHTMMGGGEKWRVIFIHLRTSLSSIKYIKVVKHANYL